MKNTILIIDDEPDFLNMIKLRLEADGYAVETASDAQEGIAKVKTLLPDLILMDIMMPEMDGALATEALSEDPQTRRIPIIFVTAIIGDDETGGSKVNVDKKLYPAIAKSFNYKKLTKIMEDALRDNV